MLVIMLSVPLLVLKCFFRPVFPLCVCFSPIVSLVYVVMVVPLLFLRTFPDGSRAGVTFSEQSPFVIVFRKRFCDVRVSFSYVYVNQFGATFHNAQ